MKKLIVFDLLTYLLMLIGGFVFILIVKVQFGEILGNEGSLGLVLLSVLSLVQFIVGIIFQIGYSIFMSDDYVKKKTRLFIVSHCLFFVIFIIDSGRYSFIPYISVGLFVFFVIGYKNYLKNVIHN